MSEERLGWSEAIMVYCIVIKTSLMCRFMSFLKIQKRH